MSVKVVMLPSRPQKINVRVARAPWRQFLVY